MIVPLAPCTATQAAAVLQELTSEQAQETGEQAQVTGAETGEQAKTGEQAETGEQAQVGALAVCIACFACHGGDYRSMGSLDYLCMGAISGDVKSCMSAGGRTNVGCRVG